MAGSIGSQRAGGAGERVGFGQRGPGLGRVLGGAVGKARGRNVFERMQRQAQAERRIARHQEQVFAARAPRFADPGLAVALHGQHVADRRPEPAFEHAGRAGAFLRRPDRRFQDIHAERQPGLLQDPVGRVLEGRLDESRAQAQPSRDGLAQAQGMVGGCLARAVFAGDQVGVAPDRLAVVPPVEREGPAWQAFARVPFALAVMEQAAGREAIAQLANEVVGEAALGRSDGLGVPFGGLEIVDRHEGRLAAGGQPDIARCEIGIDLPAELVERRPGLIREGQRDARRLGHAGDRHAVVELDAAGVDQAADRRGGAVMRGRGERNMAFAAQQARGGIEPDPAGARDIGFGPGMQVGEILAGSERAFDRVDIGLELDQVAGHEARRETQPAQDLHHQPGRIAARAGLQGQGLLGRLHAGFHADQIGDVLGQPGIEADQEVHRAGRLGGQRGHEIQELRAGGLGFEIGHEFGAVLRLVGEGEGLGRGLDEEVERVDDRHVGREVDLDPELRGLFRKDQPGQPVAAGVLLPVDEVIGRRDLQRIAGKRGAAMRGRAQADHLGPERNGTIVAVIGDVANGGADRHREFPGKSSRSDKQQRGRGRGRPPLDRIRRCPVLRQSFGRGRPIRLAGAISFAKLLPRLPRVAKQPRSAPLRRPFAFRMIGYVKRALVAQLDRAPDYESGGQEFESLRARQ